MVLTEARRPTAAIVSWLARARNAGSQRAWPRELDAGADRRRVATLGPAFSWVRGSVFAVLDVVFYVAIARQVRDL